MKLKKNKPNISELKARIDKLGCQDAKMVVTFLKSRIKLFDALFFYRWFSGDYLWNIYRAKEKAVWFEKETTITVKNALKDLLEIDPDAVEKILRCLQILTGNNKSEVKQ